MNAGSGAGSSAGGTVQTRFGTPQALQTNLLNPTTSQAGAPLQTLDGSASFFAKFDRPNSQKFLDVMIQPQGTGDLGVVRIGQDTDFNGSVDYSFTVPFWVSGVCGNGVIHCDPGTWNHCEYHRWIAGADARVSLEAATPLDLGGCYCINNGCGTHLAWSNTSAILHSLGGGAVGAIQAANPGYQISDVQATPVSIAYYGQDVTRTADPVTGQPTTSPAAIHQVSLYRMPTAIPGEAQGAVAAQSSQPGSLYALVNTLGSRAGGGADQRSCARDRVVQIENRSTYCAAAIPEVALPDGMAETNTYYRVETGTGRSRNDCQCNPAIDPARPSCPPVAGASVAGGAPPGSEPIGSGAEGFFGRDQKDGADDCSYHTYDYFKLCMRQFDVAVESINDGCQSLDVDPDCALWSEVADGVKVMENFNATGLAPLPSTRTFPGVAPHPVERSWWHVQRTYFCTTGTGGYDFSAAATRFGHVVSSLSSSGSVSQYEDLRLQDGAWVSTSGSLDVGSLPPPATSACEMGCKTRRQTEDYQATVVGVAAKSQTDPTRYDVLYHTCVNGVCPAGSGETIVQNCACLNEFTGAALMMQAMRLAGQDSICTSGIPQPIAPLPARPAGAVQTP